MSESSEAAKTRISPGETTKSEAGGENTHGEVGFWDPKLKDVRNEVGKQWIFITLILCASVLSILSLYWGVEFHLEKNLSSLVVYVVDFDGQEAPYNTSGITPLVGPHIVRMAESLISPHGQLGYGSLPPSHFNNDPFEVRQRIYDYKAWAAIIVNSNATALLQEAIRSGNSSYDPMGAAQIIYVQARDQDTIANYVLPSLKLFETMVTSSFGKVWAGMSLSEASRNATILSNMQRVPQAVSPAIGFSTFNLRPFAPAAATPSTTIGLFYLIIVSFFSFGFYMPIHMKFMSRPQPLKFYQMIIWRWFSAITAYLFISLAYSLISLAFQIPFSSPATSQIKVENPTNAYHHGSFAVYWMLNYIGMIALGLATENVAMILGPYWMPLWLIFWVISNVSTSLYSITLAPHFYYWGYAWPLHNIVQGSRTILLGVHSRIGLNFGILFAWIAVNTSLYPFCCYFMRWKKEREKKEAQKKEE